MVLGDIHLGIYHNPLFTYHITYTEALETESKINSIICYRSFIVLSSPLFAVTVTFLKSNSS